MTLNPKIVLVCATCILVSGFFGSYKSFQIFEDQTIKNQIQKSQTIAEYLGQNLEQKLKTIEASVSYLDQSTVETLKRFGVRYFAYSYKKDGEWSVKWKVLGELKKEGILAEVKPLAFSELAQDRRHWQRSKNNELIYITPVALAKSHQLKDGFLVFGIEPSFFKELKTGTESYFLVDHNKKDIFGGLPKSLQSDESFLLAESQQAQHRTIPAGQGATLSSAVFLPQSQLWVIRQESLSQAGFFSSAIFFYFLLASGIGIGLLILILLGRETGATASRKRLAWPVFDFRAWWNSFIPRQAARVESAPTEPEDTFAAEPVEVADFADFLDHLLADEMRRLQKVGVSIKTQVEEGARVMCSPQRVTDFIQRLIGNSVLSLEDEKEKEIQIQLVEQADSYQLIYVDTRCKHFPSKQPASLMAQTEGSLQGIDGIIAYAGWLFGERLTVAKKGFCLSIDLPKPAQAEVATLVRPLPETEVTPLQDTIERIEIRDQDTDHDMIAQFEPMETVLFNEERSVEEREEELQVSFDDVIDQFRMKDFNFTPSDDRPIVDNVETETEGVEQSTPEEPAREVTSSDSVDLKENDKGLFEFSSGDFKIKIRSPKKRGIDVNR